MQSFVMGLDSIRCFLTQACHVVFTSRCDGFLRPSIRPNKPQSTPPPPHSLPELLLKFLIRPQNRTVNPLLSVFRVCRSCRENKKEIKKIEFLFFLTCVLEGVAGGIASNFLLLLYKAHLVYFHNTVAYTQIQL
jgi:hypothetical protein